MKPYTKSAAGGGAWTKVPPDEPGFYWVRYHGDVGVTELVIYDGKPWSFSTIPAINDEPPVDSYGETEWGARMTAPEGRAYEQELPKE